MSSTKCSYYLLILITFLSTSVICEAKHFSRSYKNVTKASYRKDFTMKENCAHTSGGKNNRIQFGCSDTNPWPWLVPVYTDPDLVTGNRTCEGNMIIIRGPIVFMHTITADKILLMECDESPISVPSPASFPKYKGPTPVRSQLLKILLPSIIYTFNQYAIYTHRKRFPHPEDNLKNSFGPILESDINEIGQDCYGYGWSGEPINQRSNRDEVTYVKFKVETWRRLDGSIRVRTVQPAFCDGLDAANINDRSKMGRVLKEKARSRATPILCGPQQKLTYLAHFSQMPGCDLEMEAFHVAKMLADARTKGFDLL